MSRYTYTTTSYDHRSEYCSIFKDDILVVHCAPSEVLNKIDQLECADVCRCFHSVHANSTWLRYPNMSAKSGMCRSKDTLKSRT